MWSPGAGVQLVPTRPPPQESALKALGTEGLFLFSSLDTDRDLYLSPEEFGPLAEKLTGTGAGGTGGGSQAPRAPEAEGDVGPGSPRHPGPDTF